MDGVIIDSEKIYQEIEREMYSELGITVTDDEHHMFMGTSERSMWEHMVETHSPDLDSEALVAKERKRFLAMLRSPEGIPLVPGIENLLDLLANLRLPLYIASSSSREIIHAVLRQYDLEDRFSGIVSGDDAELSKPAPDIFLKTCTMADTLPERCIVIEDAENGIRAAKYAGMRVIALANPGLTAPGRETAHWIAGDHESVGRIICQLIEDSGI